jgi:hypothetical protein
MRDYIKNSMQNLNYEDSTVSAIVLMNNVCPYHRVRSVYVHSNFQKEVPHFLIVIISLVLKKTW